MPRASPYLCAALLVLHSGSIQRQAAMISQVRVQHHAATITQGNVQG